MKKDTFAMVAGGVVALMARWWQPFGNAKKGAKRWLFFLLQKSAY